ERLARDVRALPTLQVARDRVALRLHLVVDDDAVLGNRREWPPLIAEDVALDALIDVAVIVRVVHVDEPIGEALAVADDLGGDLEPPRVGVVEDLRDVRQAEKPAGSVVHEVARPGEHHRHDRLEEMQDDDDRLDDVVADDSRHPFQDRLEYVGPAADDVRHGVADAVADVLAAAVASEETAEEVADAADDAAHRVAHGVHDGVAD